MLKPLVLLAACAAAAFGGTFVGRSVYSSQFQAAVPFGSALKTTVDPSSVWSWHYSFPNAGATTVDVLVDLDGNNRMDTEVPWARVMITDAQIVQLGSGGSPATAWIVDGNGRRWAVGSLSAPGSVGNSTLTTPIVLPVGSPLR